MASLRECGRTLPLFDFGVFDPEPVAPVARRKRGPRRARKVEVDSLLHALSLPLFDFNGAPSVEAAIDDETFDALVVIDSDEVGEDKIPWSLDGILTLHSVLLQESLSALRGSGNSLQKREILEWIFEPELLGSTRRDGREIPIRADRVPFTFAFCCKLEMMDADNIRSFILQRLPEQTRHFFH